MIILLLSFLIILNHSGASNLEDAPNICLETGACYQGVWKVYDDLRYASFQGIRYAQAPSGNLRFKPPVAYFDTEGVFDVSEDLEIGCPQVPQLFSPTKGQEDCLFLNLYVPEKVGNILCLSYFLTFARLQNSSQIVHKTTEFLN